MFFNSLFVNPYSRPGTKLHFLILLSTLTDKIYCYYANGETKAQSWKVTQLLRYYKGIWTYLFPKPILLYKSASQSVFSNYIFIIHILTISSHK